jgi:hypothetical protein
MFSKSPCGNYGINECLNLVIKNNYYFFIGINNFFYHNDLKTNLFLRNK